MKETDRDEVFNKYGGKCAYCGGILPAKGWQADHIEPHFRGWPDSALEKYGRKKGGHNVANLNPACARCNRWKSTFDIEQFRTEIQAQVERLNRYSNNYRMALDYGLVSETTKPVVFYFETLTP